MTPVPAPMLAGFDPSTPGRFSGVHRGAFCIAASTPLSLRARAKCWVWDTDRSPVARASRVVRVRRGLAAHPSTLSHGVRPGPRSPSELPEGRADARVQARLRPVDLRPTFVCGTCLGTLDDEGAVALHGLDERAQRG